MKIATYNLLKGGPLRLHWARMLEDHAVELLLAQESYAQVEHLPPLLYPELEGRSVWAKAAGNQWGSAVFSKNGVMKSIEVPGFTGWVVGSEISGTTWPNDRCDPLCVFSIHAPSGLGSYSKQVNKLLDEINRIADQRDILIGGDFNLTVSHWCGSERPVSNQDLAIQRRLSDEFGLLNCWQEANPNQPLHQTLRWSADRTVPYHCDGLFVPKSWKKRLQACTVLNGEDWNRLSDHNPVVAHFT